MKTATPILRVGTWTKGSYSDTPPQKNKGFTFIELVVVLAVLSSVLVFVIPKISSRFPETCLFSSARYISACIAGLHAESAFSGKKCVMRVSIDENRYCGFKETDSGDMHPLKSGKIGAGGKLLKEVRFEDVVVDDKKVVDGKIDIEFSPYGVSEVIVIHLVNASMQRCSIMVDCFIGRARVVKGYVQASGFE